MGFRFFHRNFMRMPLSEAPRWVIGCIIVFVTSIIMVDRRIVPERFAFVLVILMFASGGAAACYVAWWSLNNIMKTGSGEDDNSAT